jgi:hypothetical protein
MGDTLKDQATLELHALCTLFPRMSDDEFAGLRADIAANGQRTPITLYGGKILDGGHRYRACLAEGKTPRFVEFDGGDPVAYVLSLNLRRRHLSVGQQAAIVAAAQDWSLAHGPGRAPEQFTRTTPLRARGAAVPPESGSSAGLTTVADRAAMSGASERTQRLADKVAKSDAELIKQVARGEVLLSQAVAKVSGKPIESPMADLPPSKVPAVTPPPAAAPAEPEIELGIDGADDEGPSLAQIVDEQTAEIADLRAQLAAAEADDKKAEVLKMRRAFDHRGRELEAAVARAAKADERSDWLTRQLTRCGKAVGQADLPKVAPAVEALARSTKVAA